MPIDLTAVQAAIAAIPKEEKPEGYKIAGVDADGNPVDAKEQGRRAAHHADRIQQACEIAEAQDGGIGYLIEAKENEIAELEHARAQIGRIRDEATDIDRFLLSQWMEYGDIWNKPGKPRRKTQSLGLFRLVAKKRSKREGVDIRDEDALMEMFPGLVKEPPPPELALGYAKKFVMKALKDNAQAIPPEVAVRVRGRQWEEYVLEFAGAKVTLKGDDENGNGNGTDVDGGGHPEGGADTGEVNDVPAEDEESG